jgi:hypothetical protein
VVPLGEWIGEKSAPVEYGFRHVQSLCNPLTRVKFHAKSHDYHEAVLLIFSRGYRKASRDNVYRETACPEAPVQRPTAQNVAGQPVVIKNQVRL